MGLFKNLKLGLEAARNPPTRASYEEATAQAQASYEQAKAISERHRILKGPAGEYLYGAGMAGFDPTAIPDIGAMFRRSMGEFRTAVKQSFNRDELPQIDDPQQREQAAAADRAVRAQARAPYRAPNAVPVEITRIATRGASQVQEVAAFLGSSGFAGAPERVWGVYRVPDRISHMLTTHSEKGRVVEWDVVHTGGPALGACTPPAATSFASDDRWVGRHVGEPSLIDEDLGIAYLRAAGIGPDQSLGLARYCEFREPRGGISNDEDNQPLLTLIRGLLSFHPSGDGGTYDRMRAAAPIILEPHPEDVIVYLNWEEVAKVVHPRTHHPYSVPSLFPYLPSTPQELLRSYLEVVGVRPTDTWGVQATVNRARELRAEGVMTTNLGPKQPCADGKPRMRAHGCQIVTVAYRDRPEYVAGRERWQRYESEVLQAALTREAPRPPIASDDITDGVPRVLHGLVKAADLVDRVTDIGWGGEDFVPYRYCSPPIQ